MQLRFYKQIFTAPQKETSEPPANLRRTMTEPERPLADEAAEVNGVQMLPVKRIARAWRALERQRDAWSHLALFAGSKANELRERLDVADEGSRQLLRTLKDILRVENATVDGLQAMAEAGVRQFMLAGTATA